MRNKTNRGLRGADTPMHTFGNPLQNPHVLAVFRPEKRTVSILSEPVDHEDLGWMGKLAVHPEPVTDVIGDVVATERKHRHRIAAHDADLTARCRCSLRAHRRA